MLSECSLMLGLLWCNRRAEGAGSSWKDFLTTTLLKSAGTVCEWFMEMTTKQRHWQLQTGTLMYKCALLCTYTQSAHINACKNIPACFTKDSIFLKVGVHHYHIITCIDTQ